MINHGDAYEQYTWLLDVDCSGWDHHVFIVSRIREGCDRGLAWTTAPISVALRNDERTLPELTAAPLAHRGA